MIRFDRLDLPSVAEVLRRLDSFEQDPPELLAMAAGSPGAVLEHRSRWAALPTELMPRLRHLPNEPMQALALARDVCEALDGEQQLWLINWWQQALWTSSGDVESMKRLETLRRHLLSFVQPRLAWEVALLDLTKEARSALA